MFRLFLRINLLTFLLFFVVGAYELQDHVFIQEDPTRISFVDDTFFASYNYLDDSYRAFDIRDSGFPEVANPKNIYDGLKYRYLQQQPLAQERNSKETE